jgi:hypothetical protein
MTDQKQASAKSEEVATQDAASTTKDSIADSALDKVAGGRVGAPARRNTRLF